MAWIAPKDTFLTDEQQINNAQEFCNFFNGTEWTKTAILGILGNCHVESTINPNMYEHGYTWRADRGFGLVQWTPRSNLENFASSKGLNFRHGDTQLMKFLDELEAESIQDHRRMQWYPTTKYNFSFHDYIINRPNLSINQAVEAFFLNYERPADAYKYSLPDRQAYANFLSNKITYKSGSGVVTPPSPDESFYPSEPQEGSGEDELIKNSYEDITSGNKVFNYNNGSLLSNTNIKIDKEFNNLYNVSIEKVSLLDKITDIITPPTPPSVEPDPSIPPDPSGEDAEPNPSGVNYPVDMSQCFISAYYKGYFNDFGAHSGVDFASNNGELGTVPIFAAQSGTVIEVKKGCASRFGNNIGDFCHSGFGNHLKIKHIGDSYYTMYAHCHDIIVSEGQIVKKGQQIAWLGNSGNSSGPHLHFEVSKNGQFGPSQVDINVFNPIDYLK